MNSKSLSPITGMLASGGLDSSILLAHLVARRERVQSIDVCFGLFWQGAELTALRRFLDAVGGSALRPLVVLDMPVADLYGDHWSRPRLPAKIEDLRPFGLM